MPAPVKTRRTPKQALFVENVMMGMSAADAYRAAGYAATGARQSASRLLAKPEVQDALVKRRVDAVHAGTLPSAEDIIRGLASEARGEGPDTTASSRISAWRTLADIHGLLGGSSPELPEGLKAMLEALARGAEAGVTAVPE